MYIIKDIFSRIYFTKLYFRGPPRAFGEQGNKAIYFRRTREQKSKTEGNMEQMQFWGTGNIENQDFDFGEEGKMSIFFQGTRTGTSTPPPPHSHHGRASFLVE